jgi:peptidoglycan/LPS O-acetylase OafA/YrhL
VTEETRRDGVAALIGAAMGLVALGLLSGEAVVALGLLRMPALLALHFMGGVLVGALAARRWWLAGVVAWGAIGAGLVALLRGPGLEGPAWTLSLLLAVLLAAAALAGGWAADRFWRHTGDAA